PGRMIRPATTQPATASAPAPSTSAVTTAAFAMRTRRRPGSAHSVTPMVPVSYSAVIASTASATTAICPTPMPLSTTRAVSRVHAGGRVEGARSRRAGGGPGPGGPDRPPRDGRGHRGQQRPAGGADGAQLRPLHAQGGQQGADHASLRRRRQWARPRATATYAP